MRRWLNLRTVLILGTILLVLGATIARWKTERFRESEYRKFSDQSIQLAGVFAKAANAWLARGNQAALDGATGLMLAGSAQYVRISLLGEVVLDERTDNPEIAELDLTSDLVTGGDLRAQSELQDSRLDVVILIELPGQRGTPVGVVQIGFSDTYARAQVRSHRTLVLGLTAGSWLILMPVAVFAVRTMSMRSRLSAAQSLEAQLDGIIHCGTLEIDTRTCAVRLSEKSIDLTPKMFELLTFLACNAGKTFSDSDLLTALWTDAPYAASGDVKQCIYMLRRRLGVACADPKRIIVNVKGFGYKLEAPTEAELSHD